MCTSTHLKEGVVPALGCTSDTDDLLGWQMLLILGLDNILLMCYMVICMYGRKVTEVGFLLDPAVVMGGLRD
jgi:hypothetical protein